MIPSRGLRWSGQIIGIGRRRIGVSPSRQFSSSIVQHAPLQGNPLLSPKRSSIAQISVRAQVSKTNFLIRIGAGVRFASSGPLPSTSSAASTTAVTPADAASSAAASPSEFASTSLDDVTDWSIVADTPHYIGYLKHLGLEYGYGPTAGMEWVLEHIHVLAGTPWWATIAVTAVLVRIALFKLYVMAADNGTRMQITMPITKPLTAKMMEAQARGDQAGMMDIRNEIKRINTRAGVHVWRSILPFVGAISTFGTFSILRAMSKLPVPGLETGGLLWFHNLTIPDPYFILPIVTAGILHWVLRRGGEFGTSSMQPQVMKIFMWLMPTLSLLFTFWLPASVQVTFLTTGILSFIQTTLMSKPWFRNYFGMLPRPEPIPEGPPPSPYKGRMNRSASPALSQAEFNARFQSTTTSRRVLPEPPSKFKKLIQGPLKPIEDAMKTIVDQARTTMGSRAVGDEKKKADAYEAKRRKEIEEDARQRANSPRQRAQEKARKGPTKKAKR